MSRRLSDLLLPSSFPSRFFVFLILLRSSHHSYWILFKVFFTFLPLHSRSTQTSKNQRPFFLSDRSHLQNARPNKRHHPYRQSPNRSPNSKRSSFNPSTLLLPRCILRPSTMFNLFQSKFKRSRSPESLSMVTNDVYSYNCRIKCGIRSREVEVICRCSSNSSTKSPTYQLVIRSNL